jgi:uncharacterized protein YndB with AHSA1/START domain
MTMEAQASSVESVRKTITVRAPRERAFDVFTRQMGRWWPRTHSIGAGELADAIIEPHVGGRWYERAEDGSECEWGKVLAWDPPARVLLAWQIDGAWKYDEQLLTEVEASFTEVEPGLTRVDLEHRGLDQFGPARDEVCAALDSPNGWGGLLSLFAEAVDQGALEQA